MANPLRLALKRVFEEGAPSGLGSAHWRALLDNLAWGNRQLQHIYADPNRAPFEWGAWVTPQTRKLPQTQLDQFSVDVGAPRTPQPHAVVYHSHPHVVTAGERQMPAGLSAGDLQSLDGGPFSTRGITSLEPEGGFGYALRHDKSPNIEDDQIWQEMWSAARQAAAKSPQAGPRFTMPGVGARVGAATDELPEDMIAAQFAMARALHRRGWLERYGYLPGTRKQAATLDAYGPAAEAGSRAVDDVLTQRIAPGPLFGALAALGFGGEGLRRALAERIEARV